MTSAVHLVFGIPELVVLLASTLDLHDLSHFILTNRFIHTHSLPTFKLARQYHSLDLRALVSQRKFSSPDEIAALLRNVHLVSNIRMDAKFFDHYYDCLASTSMLEQRQVNATGTGDPVASATDAQSTIDAHFSTSTASATSLMDVMVPRMTRLARFEYNLPRPGLEWYDESDGDFADRPETIFPKFRLMIPSAQASHLQSLTLNGMRIKHQRDLNDVARSISAMTGLQTLRLGFEHPEELRDDIIPRIFFSLPSSIQVFTIRPMDLGSDQNPVKEAQDADNVYRRDGPLLNLKEYDVCMNHLMDSPEPYFLMLPHCPELELVMVPQMWNRDDEASLAYFIIRSCPKLRRVSRVDLGFSVGNGDEEDHSPYGQCDGLMWNLTNQAMPVDTLESFYYSGFYESENMSRARLTSLLAAQFGSLTEVQLRNTRSLCGYSVSQLLNFATVLEKLVIDGPGGLWDDPYGVPLQRLSDVSWASTRLRELRLVVDVGYLTQRQRRNGQQGPFSLSKIDIDVMILSLGGCLANIGRQKDLRVLDLRVAIPLNITYQSGNPWTYRDETFPGLLTLDNRADGGPPGEGVHIRRGLLELLGRLSKLEELRGSVSLIPRNAYGYTTGREEAEWMLAHWPKLKVAEFYPTKGESTSPIADEFLWLQEQLSGLVFTDSHSAF